MAFRPVQQPAPLASMHAYGQGGGAAASSPPAFNVAGAAQGPFTPGVQAKLLFAASEEYDPDSVWNTATSRFTAPATGAYEFTLKVARPVLASAVGTELILYKNGVQFNSLRQWTGVWTAEAVTFALKLNSTDYVEFYLMTDTAWSTVSARIQGKLIRTL